MNPRILRRFVILMVIGIVAFVSFQTVYDYFTSSTPGDFYVREGDIRLSDGKYEKALDSFNKALEEMPNHRGALMGRALVFIQSKQYQEAIAELDYLISFLEKELKPDDPTGIGVLAAAYSNRGVVYDRMGQYEKALEDYVAALNTDQETVEGPGVIHKILYGSEKVSTVRERAQYIYEQLQLPEEERLLRIPEIDAKQRMYKP